MICRDKIIFSCLVACGLGAAGGYIYSSRFCKVSIVKRVAKEVALNQNLRQLLSEHSFWIQNYIRSVFLNSPDELAIANRLNKNQEELSNIFKAYYGASASNELKKLITEKTNLINQIVHTLKETKASTDITNAWMKNSDELARLLSQLNPTWAFSHDALKKDFSNQLSLITQEIEAMQKNNWQRTIEIFNKNFEFAMQLADTIDKGITTQFPEKF